MRTPPAPAGTDGAIDPSTVLTQVGDMPSVLEAYQTSDQRQTGWTKVALDPSS